MIAFSSYYLFLFIPIISNCAYQNRKNNDVEAIQAGIFGKYPIHGGNMQNQQISINSQITTDNINTIKPLCIYNSSKDYGFKGYITVDHNEYGYFTDSSGYIKCIDLNSCSLVWKINMTQLINDDFAITSLNTPTLFQNANGEKGVIFGVISGQTQRVYHSCSLLAVNIENGELMFNTIIIDESSIESTMCQIHGVMIDNDFAYGGVSSFANGLPPHPSYLWRGKVFKINVNNGELVNEWYSLPEYDDNIDLNEVGFYSGASIWPIHSVIDDYFVFGTGQLYTYPKRIGQCLSGNTTAVPLEYARPFNPQCGKNMNDILKWRCLEHNVHPDSLIILNKNTFRLEAAVPLYGVDAWGANCEQLRAVEQFMNETEIMNALITYYMTYLQSLNVDMDITEVFDSFMTHCPKVIGPDADSVAVASYTHNGKSYVAVGQKTGQFYVIEIPSGVVKISKKIGPWSAEGGSSPFSMAVDEENMIAIFSFRGVFTPRYKYKLADNTIICDSGSIHAIDLNTGYTIWQWINPYGKIGANECNDTMYDNYIDLTVEGTCQRSFDGSDMLPANKTVINVVKPPVNDLLPPIESKQRALNIGPVTISNNMVFIPTMTGEIYIHNIKNGEYLNKLHCPDNQIIYNNDLYWNRGGTRSGVTIYDDKIIFYCGATWLHPLVDQAISTQNVVSNGGQVVVMKGSGRGGGGRNNYKSPQRPRRPPPSNNNNNKPPQRRYAADIASNNMDIINKGNEGNMSDFQFLLLNAAVSTISCLLVIACCISLYYGCLKYSYSKKQHYKFAAVDNNEEEEEQENDP